LQEHTLKSAEVYASFLATLRYAIHLVETFHQLKSPTSQAIILESLANLYKALEFPFNYHVYRVQVQNNEFVKQLRDKYEKLSVMNSLRSETDQAVCDALSILFEFINLHKKEQVTK